TGTSTSVFQKHESELTPFEQEYKERIEECRNRYYIGKGYSQNDYVAESENCVPHEKHPGYSDYATLYEAFWKNKFNKDTNNPNLPLRAYSYTSKYEFFADSFAVWYHVKSNYLANDITEARGSITPSIENLLNNLLCNPTYDKFYVSNASICTAS
ncbi:MAG: hypothetical protein IK122_01550, partial [Alphaproteobacteria bacterium]|nr:hypothetical protein [Alphaproteobacteria bacterium]